ncbi:MAG: hypothetical protein HKL83_04135 [Acidimicrobiaceae bacterium]|nr:hypothetical protein [Acidimicrobiaceae bacterium]
MDRPEPGGLRPFLGIPPGVVLRGPTGVRSVYHQLAKRTKGHLFVSVLAYYLLSAIEATMERNGNHSLFSIKETLSPSFAVQPEIWPINADFGAILASFNSR